MSCYDIYDQISFLFRQTRPCYLNCSCGVHSLPRLRLCVYAANVAKVGKALTQAPVVFVETSSGKQMISCVTREYWLLFIEIIILIIFLDRSTKNISWQDAITDRRDKSRIDDTAAPEHTLEARRKPSACCSIEMFFINKMVSWHMASHGITVRWV